MSQPVGHQSGWRRPAMHWKQNLSKQGLRQMASTENIRSQMKSKTCQTSVLLFIWSPIVFLRSPVGCLLVLPCLLVFFHSIQFLWKVFGELFITNLGRKNPASWGGFRGESGEIGAEEALKDSILHSKTLLYTEIPLFVLKSWHNQ